MRSKGSANFVMKWKESKREAAISVTTIKGLVRDITGDTRDAPGCGGRQGALRERSFWNLCKENTNIQGGR